MGRPYHEHFWPACGVLGAGRLVICTKWSSLSVVWHALIVPEHEWVTLVDSDTYLCFQRTTQTPIFIFKGQGRI